MGIVLTYTRHAKCKDCGYLKGSYRKKICTNEHSIHFNEHRCLNDLVCYNWSISDNFEIKKDE
jgi:hypothetical protein